MSSFNFQTGIFSCFTPKTEFSSTPSREKSNKKEKKNVLTYRHSLESKNREKRWVMGEHLKQIKHLNRRVAEIGSLIERKKKAYDMIGHPVLFLRGKSQKDPRLKAGFLERVLKRPEKIQVYEDTIKTCKSFVGNNKEKQVKELANMLLDVIVQRRLYKNKDLHEFFENVRSNCVLDKNWVEDAIELVLNRLEM